MICIIIIFCISIISLILSSLSYVKSRKNTKMSSKLSNQTDSNLVTIPLQKISGGNDGVTAYKVKSADGHIFITQISNLKPNCSVILSFNDFVVNLPVDSNGIAYPGGKKGQPLMLVLLPLNDIRLTTQDNSGKVPIGTFSSVTWKGKFLMSLVSIPQGGPSQICNYNQSDIVTRTGMIQNGSIGFPDL